MLTLPIFLLWIGLAGMFLFLWASGQPPFHFLSPRQLILYTEEMKLFFLLIIMPFLIKPCPKTNDSYQKPDPLSFYGWNFLQIIVFLLLFLPLSIFCAEIAGIGYSRLALVHLLYGVIAGVLLMMRYYETTSRLNLSRFYYVIIFGLGLIGSLIYYLQLELCSQSIGFILYLNPFWLIWRILY